MNIIPEKSPFITGNYLCTWGFQSGWHPLYEGISGSEEGLEGHRNGLDEEALLKKGGILDSYPPELRGDIIIVLDDGWDVSYNTANPRDRARFGACDPSPDRFPGMGKTQTERLTNLNAAVKSFGFAGLGLWISPQFPGQPAESYDAEKFRRHFSSCIECCAKAGIAYWKIDWGEEDQDLDCRMFISETAEKYAPSLLIEHAYTGGVLADSDERKSYADYPQKLEFYGKCIRNGDFWRIYDVWPMAHSVSMNRLANVFREGQKAAYGPVSQSRRRAVNVEDQPEIGAPLGCSVGFMRHPSLDPAEIERQKSSLMWYRIAPPFAVDAAETFISDEALTDDDEYIDWGGVNHGFVKTVSPAAISRGTALPVVTVAEGDEKPFAAAAINPITGASSIGTFSRTLRGKSRFDMANVSFNAGSPDCPLGIFGSYNSLAVTFGASIEGKRVMMQKLTEKAAVDITEDVQISGSKLVIPGAVTDKFDSAAVLILI